MQMANTTDSVAFRALRDIGAGTFAGVCQILTIFPFDTIKTRLQTAGCDRFSGAIHCARTTVEKESWRGLYKGMAFPFYGVALINTFIFGVNGSAKGYLKRRKGTEKLSALDLVACGAFTGLARTSITTPIELIKTQLQVQYGWIGEGAPVFKGPLDCLRKVIKSNGLTGIYRGWAATVLRDIPAVTAWFGFYDLSRRLFDHLNVPKAGIPFAGSLAGVGFWLSCIAQDTVKSVIQTTPLHEKAPSIVQATKVVLKRAGFKGLFFGLSPSLVRAIPAGAITFIAYEAASSVINRAGERMGKNVVKF